MSGNLEKHIPKRSLRRIIGAFTLAELIVVITILAILATIGFLALSGYSQDAKNSVVATNVRSLYTAITAESAVTGNTPRYYVVHDSGASLSGGIVIIDSNSNTLTWGNWNIAGTNYSAGNPDYVKLKLNKEKFKTSGLFVNVAFADYDPKSLTVGATDFTVAAGSRTRTNSYVQVAGISSETKKASVMGNFPVSSSGSVSGLIKDPSSSSSTGALIDGNSAATPSCSWGMVWNGSACEIAGYAYAFVISTNVSDYHLRNAATAAGWNGTDPLKATVTVNVWVTVGSSSAATPAFDATGSFPIGSKLTLLNNGSIVGKWGNGWYGWTWNGSPGAGWAGGNGLSVAIATTATNNGIIAWGGGGGGGGGGWSPDCSSYCVWGGGGGGWAWSTIGNGWSGVGCAGNGGYNAWTAGGAWTTNTGGAGWNRGANGWQIAGYGWAGWALWTNGVGGGNASTSCSPTAWAAGGAAGTAVSGNSNVTWVANWTKIWASN